MRILFPQHNILQLHAIRLNRLQHFRLGDNLFIRQLPYQILNLVVCDLIAFQHLHHIGVWHLATHLGFDDFGEFGEEGSVLFVGAV